MKTRVKMAKLFLIFICLSLLFQCVSSRHIPRIPHIPRNIKCKRICARNFDLCLNDREINFGDIFTLCLDSKDQCMSSCRKMDTKEMSDIAFGAGSLHDIIEYESTS